MARNAPLRFTKPLTVGDLQQVLDHWVANKQGRNAPVVIVPEVGALEMVVIGSSVDYDANDGRRVLMLVAEEVAS
jgi:hypothetical protein